MIDVELATATVTGLVLMEPDGVRWHNTAAGALVHPHGGSWTGPTTPATQLAEVRPGSRRAPLRWPSPRGTRWWEVSATPIATGVLYEITDETERYAADLTGPATAQWRLERLERMTGQGSFLWHLHEGTIEFSEALGRIFGMPAGRPFPAAEQNRVHPDDIDRVTAIVTAAVAAAAPYHYVARVLVGVDRGEERVFECHGEVFTDADGRARRVMGTMRDITDQDRQRRELAYLADHDPLTGVANRRRIAARLAECAAGPGGAALLMIDVDHIKDVNDLRGHAFGDSVIRRVAETVSARLDDGALLGRLGGDEFAVLVPALRADAALALAERLRAAVKEGSALDPMLPVSISVGVTTVEPGQSADAVLARADLALYAAKAAGRNRVRCYTHEQYRAAAERVSLEQRVAAALENGTMELDAQPIVDLGTSRPLRHEVLLRMRDGLEPAVGPAVFLPVAERTDLVLEIDRWVLRRVVEALATPAARAAGLRLEANVSARSLDAADLGPWVLDLLAEAGVEPGRLGLEITETAAVGSLDAAEALALRLTEAGCGIALDDFGAGYGSFTYLKTLPFTTVKIAGEFVRQLDADRVDRAMVAGVVGVAHELGMRTVAEQVDRPELVDGLRALGVDDGQGYLLGRPRPLAELLEG